MALITFAQQQAIKPISANNQTKYPQLATEAENNELRKLMGAAFLQAVQADPELYEDLLDGATFVNCKGQSVAHRGARFVLAYLVYSAYIDESNIADTYTGFAAKNRQESRDIAPDATARIRERARSIALQEWELIKEYLDENTVLYPLWDCSESNKKIYKPNFRTLRKYGTQGRRARGWHEMGGHYDGE